MNKLEEIANTLIKYLEVRSEMLKLRMREHIADIITSLILFFILLFFLLLFFLTGSIVAAIVINKALDSHYLGYLIMMGGHLLLFFILYASRKGIIKAIIYNFVFEEHVKKKKGGQDE